MSFITLSPLRTYLSGGLNEQLKAPSELTDRAYNNLLT